MADKFTSVYKTEHELSIRQKHYKKLVATYPDRIPVVIEKVKNTKTPQPEIKKSRFLFPEDLTMTNIYYVVKQYIDKTPQDSIYLFVNNTLMNTSATLASIYEEHKEPDGFLYIYYTVENTFG